MTSCSLCTHYLQVLPVHPHNGWVLADMGQGLRVFTRFFPSLSSTALPCVAASIILDVPPKVRGGSGGGTRFFPSLSSTEGDPIVMGGRGGGAYPTSVVRRRAYPTSVVRRGRCHCVACSLFFVMFMWPHSQ